MKIFYKSLLIGVAILTATSFNSKAQFAFTDSNSRLSTQAFHSGCTVAVVDVNKDGLDDIVRLSQGHDLYVEYQKVGAQFTEVHIGDFGGGNGWSWGMAVADVDHNGYMDVLAGGYSTGNPIRIMKLNNTGTGGTLYTIPNGTFFLQNVTFLDVNNDGWEDIFMCDDNAPAHIYMNDGTGNFAASNIINFTLHPGNIGNDPKDSGNYGSVWTDFDNDGDLDLYIAKCRQASNDPNDPRRIDVLFQNNGNGTFTNQDTTYGVANGAQTWTASFGDIDNDGDQDLMVTNHDVNSQIFENDGTGHYSDITINTNFVVSTGYTPIESVMEDFDNDGLLDILITGDYARMFHNDGNQQFTEVTGLFNNNNMESFAIGDLNHDGFVDIYGSYANIYTTPTGVNDVIWLNTINNGNHFITFQLKGTVSNSDAIGAKVNLYGPWGVQVREVRAGESYGTMNTEMLHFGIGTNTSVDSAVIHWPSGLTTVLTNPTTDQFITVIEGDCVSPDNQVTANGPLVICPGQSTTLFANTGTGYSWLWQDNTTTTQTFDATITGDYAVKLGEAGNNCTSVSPIVHLTLNPVETPTVTVTGNLTFCEGGSVTLMSSSAAGYSWNDASGSTTQSITVTTPGNYVVTVPGTCQSWSSDTTTVSVLAAPAPTTTGATIPSPGTATISAVGSSISWYDAATGGTLLGTGSPWTTPSVNGTTTFYAEDATTYGGGSAFGGKTYSAGQYSGSTATNNWVIFDVLSPSVLKSVKVYTDTPGDRVIELRDNTGAVLQSLQVTIPMDSSRVTLNFTLTPGTNYELGTNSAFNQTSLGFTGPRLQRNNDPSVAYPYDINGLVSLTGSPAGGQTYYYFYDWEVELPSTICVSTRTPTVVTVVDGISNINNENGFGVYPNPASGSAQVLLNFNASNNATLELQDVTGRAVLTQSISDATKGSLIDLNLKGIAQGVYMVNINSNGIISTQKLIVE